MGHPCHVPQLGLVYSAWPLSTGTVGLKSGVRTSRVRQPFPMMLFASWQKGRIHPMLGLLASQRCLACGDAVKPPTSFLVACTVHVCRSLAEAEELTNSDVGVPRVLRTLINVCPATPPSSRFRWPWSAWL